MFWFVIYLYLPLMLLDAGWSASWIGITLGLLCLPLVLLELPIGRWTDKVGCRSAFLIGYGIMGVLSFLAFLSGDILVAAVLVLLSSIGGAFIEGSLNAYFFEVTSKSEEERFFGVLTTAGAVLGTLAMLLAATTVSLFPGRFVFALLSALMLSMFALSIGIPRPDQRL